MLIAPDFSPQHFAGWHILNTTLQKMAGERMHIITPTSASEQFAAINSGNIDIIYANPFDAAYLVRKLGYKAIAKPIDKPDEMVIATGANSKVKVLADLKIGDTIALASNKDVKLIGLRLLEAVDLSENDLKWQETENYQAAARMTIEGKTNAAFFLAESYHNFSKLTHHRMRKLIESAMDDINHIVLVKEKTDAILNITNSLIKLAALPDKKWILSELGIPKGFTEMTQEDTEFMIDIIDTLLD